MLANILGWLGAILILIAYSQVNFKRWSADAKIFQVLNLLGSAALVYKASAHQVWPSVLLNVFWALIAANALWKRLS